MVGSTAARCRLRALGTLVGLVATVAVGMVARSLSGTTWHSAAVTVLVGLAVASALVLLVGHLRLATGTDALGRGLLAGGLAGALVAAVGLVVLGALALLVPDDPAASAITTWCTALAGSGAVLLGAQGRAQARPSA
ncbi:hypothetical protein [Phycicoccus avicenniae]|uniref:hypothetical protein n=1 Tax=Phycicoccus avicenniae TaxID=2828860 RepID=UPI003D266776